MTEHILRQKMININDLCIKRIMTNSIQEHTFSQEFDKSIHSIPKENKPNSTYGGLSKIAVCLITAGVISLISTMGIAVNAATDGAIGNWLSNIFTAQIIDDDNSDLIGTAVQDYSNNINNGSNDSIKDNCDVVTGLPHNTIIQSLADDSITPPSSITLFSTENGNTPEVIMMNGSAVVFACDGENGWKCGDDEILIFDFEKYDSEVTDNQILIVGYILDGVMYPGEEFSDIKGSYSLKLEKGGEYYVYIISATSDYLSLKQGKITIQGGN